MINIHNRILDGVSINSGKNQITLVIDNGQNVVSIIDMVRLFPTERDIHRISRFVQDYQKGLEAIDIRTCGLKECIVDETEQKIYLVKPFVGTSFNQMMRRYQPKDFLEGYLRILEICQKCKDQEYGIDPCADNFRFKKDTLFYVDFFYPFSKDYVAWKRSRLDLNDLVQRHYYQVQDFFFYPDVFCHAAFDAFRIHPELESEIIKTTRRFLLNANFEEFDTRYEEFKRGHEK